RSAYRVAKDKDFATTFWHEDGVAATRTTLRQRGIPVMDDCAVCSSATETANHLFFHCTFAEECWSTSGLKAWAARVRGFGVDFKLFSFFNIF
ncbi:hypothetical protein LINGRAHAP2_LOCUS20605, partial [Linum grandiflorum]